MLLLVPSDPLRPRAADPHFAPEARAAREAGVEVALLDHDALIRGDVTRAVARVPEAVDVVYRGWMVTSCQYADLDAASAVRGARLRTTAEAYRRAHELPGWYGALAAYTPESVWGADIDELCGRLGSCPAVLRDHVKSMKHYWAEATFVPDVADLPAARRIAARFVELREDSFAGGLVLRRYEPLTAPEVRTWWVDACRVSAGPHPDTPDDLPAGTGDLPDVGAPIRELQRPVYHVVASV